MSYLGKPEAKTIWKYFPSETFNLKFQRKRCDVPKKRGMHAATQGSKTYKLLIASQVEQETRTDGQAERALSDGCVLVECGRVTFQLRIGCVRKSCMLVVS